MPSPNGQISTAILGCCRFFDMSDSILQVPRPDTDTDLITVTTFSMAHEAHMLKTYLEAEEIPTFIQDEHMIGLNWFYSNALGGIKVQVRRCDLDRAMQIHADLTESIVCTKEQQQECVWL